MHNFENIDYGWLQTALVDLIKRANFFRMYGIDRAVEWPAGTNGERGERREEVVVVYVFSPSLSLPLCEAFSSLSLFFPSQRERENRERGRSFHSTIPSLSRCSPQ